MKASDVIGFWIWFISLTIVCPIIFMGDPDLMDGIIHYLMKD